MHRLSVVDGAKTAQVVLRRWLDGGDGLRRVAQEADVLRGLESSDLPVPQVIATDATGEEAGVPSLLMTRVPGHVNLAPKEPHEWLRQMAEILPKIHATTVKAPPFQSRLKPDQVLVPTWSKRPDIWREALDILRQTPPPDVYSFIHGDFQHFNILWRGNRLTGIVDWVGASLGPRDRDIGHCRLNLAVLFSVDWAERFRLSYEAAAGRRVEPWRDIEAIFHFSPEWKSFIPLQTGRRATLDTKGLYGRIDELLAIAVRRLS